MTQLNNQSKSALHAVFGDNTSFYLAKTSVALTFVYIILYWFIDTILSYSILRRI